MSYSAIHKATGQVFSRLERPHRTVPADGSIHGLWEFQESYQKNHGMAGNREAGGFVNSAVRYIHLVLFTGDVIKYKKFKGAADKNELKTLRVDKA